MTDIGTPPLSVVNNSNTHAVRVLQELLNANGASIYVDGRYAIGTDRAVARFQTDNGLNIVGYVDEDTWKKLQQPKKKAPAKKKSPEAKKEATSPSTKKKSPAKKKPTTKTSSKK
tara:strand:- start:3351 stop:3695 length:345 start_codon:yes stop_codon:yes gene_type:complete